ncbi:hypothetical protein NDU88_011286 [Pleurodeles waltl]|uniref:Uncharacterized protein n=1 Tax=Pleurodeles waltl TaxID=8319 RepID=A0AAV7R174_PLEWA|nr:hypothetical protein NDU88_011286 [Pleurodeles waltl]
MPKSNGGDSLEVVWVKRTLQDAGCCLTTKEYGRNTSNVGESVAGCCQDTSKRGTARAYGCCLAASEEWRVRAVHANTSVYTRSRAPSQTQRVCSRSQIATQTTKRSTCVSRLRRQTSGCHAQQPVPEVRPSPWGLRKSDGLAAAGDGVPRPLGPAGEAVFYSLGRSCKSTRALHTTAGRPSDGCLATDHNCQQISVTAAIEC